jgi:hypothetical protein
MPPEIAPLPSNAEVFAIVGWVASFFCVIILRGAMVYRFSKFRSKLEHRHPRIWQSLGGSPNSDVTSRRLLLFIKNREHEVLEDEELNNWAKDLPAMHLIQSMAIIVQAVCMVTAAIIQMHH